MLAELAGPGAPERDAMEADALGLLALVAGQDVEPAEGSDGTDRRWRIARKVAPDRVISTVDTQARHTRKSRSKRRDGFRGQVAAEPGPDGDLRRGLRRLPAAGQVHHCQGWPVDDDPPPSGPAARGPRAARTEEFKQAYPTRSSAEPIIAWIATQNGRRVRLRYIGTAKNDARLHTRCAALNLRTLLRHGLTYSGGAWILA